MDNEVLVAGIFVGVGLLRDVMVLGLLVMWDMVLDYITRSER